MHISQLEEGYRSWRPGQDPLDNINSLAQLLKAEQSCPHPGFPEGFFYCARWHKLGYQRPDNNVFIQALSALSIQRAAQNLPDIPIRSELEAIKANISRHYWQYKSFVGLDTYGFWKLRPKRDYFPFGKRLHRDEFFRPPDDADDTVVIYLTSDQPPEAKKWLHEVKLPQHANRPSKRVRNSFPDWQNVPAYTTFFADAMPSGFDVSVMANILYWVFTEGFALTDHDRATIRLVEDCIVSGKLQSDPYRCSPYYPSRAKMAFNLARVVGKFPEKFSLETFEKLRTLLKEPSKLAPSYPMEELLIRLGQLFLGEYKVTPTHPDLAKSVLADKRFAFFALPLAQEYDMMVAKVLSPKEYLHLKFQCLGFNAAALIEYYSLLYKYFQ